MPNKTPRLGCIFLSIWMIVFCGSTKGESSGLPSIEYGPDLVENGDFEIDTDGDGVPDGWRRHIQRPGWTPKEAILTTDNPHHGEKCAYFCFENMHRVQQTRFIQKLKVTPDTVYELSYWYRSGDDPDLWADILFTGTGPKYRTHWQPPHTEWIRVVHRFHVPESVHGKKPTDIGEVGEMGLFVQNRSAVPIWYDQVSVRPTNLTPEQMQKLACSVELAPIDTDDTLLFPGTNKTHANFLLRTRAPGLDPKDVTVLVRLASDGTITDLGRYPPSEDRIAIPLDRLPVGASGVRSYLVDRSTSTLLASHTVGIRRLDPKDIPAEIDLENAPVLRDRRNGKPFLPIGMWAFEHNRNAQQIKEIKDAGFNTFHSYRPEGMKKLDDDARAYMEALFNAAENKYDMHLMLGLPRRIAETGRIHKELPPWLEAYATRPRVLFLTTDEMVMIRHSPLSQVAAMKKLIRKHAPGVPYLAFDRLKRDFVKHTDGMVIGNLSTRSSGLLRRAMLGNDKVHVGTLHTDKDKAFPPDQEMGHAVFATIIHGSRGLFVWHWPGVRWKNEDRDNRFQLYRWTKRLSEQAPTILSEKPLPDWSPKITRAEGVSYLRRFHDGKVVYYLCPAMQKPGTITMELPGGVTGKSLYADPAITMKPGENTLTLQPKTVRLLEFVPSPK
jgi:hypothetical protein